MARKYWNNIHYIIDKEKRVIKLLPDFFNELKTFDKRKGYKKIGGSSVGDILIQNKFKSQFNAFCHITRLKLPVLSKKYINAGIILEPKIFDVLRNTLKNQKIENYKAEDYNYDYFAGVDDVLSGVPDGFMPEHNMILEIKTAGEKKQELWQKDGVDPSYRKQAQLYAILMSKKLNTRIDKYSIVALFLKDEEGDYLKPEEIDLTKRKIKTYTYKVNENEANEDIKLVKDWYYKFTNTDISPEFNFLDDADQIAYLECQNNEEYQQLINKWKSMGKADLDFND
ncbi:MAGa7180 family putative nuclease [Mycoplasmopsis felis]|uniref:MAGa7180 family putative nuclease n=1 Tax=Mycoplasmopsis felis TaxID=33923 RepID=UPI0005665DCD|nr:YqaJ viral recombinase family protein [Mycoplasmopsis felis]